MTPYVIDQKKRQEYFLFLIFFTVMSFALGYFFGYQSGHSDPKTNTAQFSGVEQSIEAAEVKDKLPENVSINNEKANIQAIKSDKNSKDNKKISVKTTKEKPKTKPKLAAKQKQTTDKKSANLKPASVKKTTITKKSDNKKSEPAKVLKPVVVDAKVSENKTELKKPVLDHANKILEQDSGSVITDAKEKQQNDNKTLKSYSVQVGMFASKPNAEKLVNELKENNFNVYLGDFISSTGQKKYNVRLGPYEERILAKDNMALYKQSYSTPAYIVINK